jgi:DNA-binding beta-propeller fold protein YncE
MKYRNVPVIFILSLLFLSAFSMSANAAVTYVFDTKWGSLGGRDGQFRQPSGIGLAYGNIYVADTGNHRIQMFSSTGTFLDKWGSLGREDGKFSSPHDVLFGGLGYIFVADTGNKRIQILDSRGNFLNKLDKREGPAGIGYEIKYPVRLAQGVYVVDSPLGKSQISGFHLFSMNDSQVVYHKYNRAVEVVGGEGKPALCSGIAKSYFGSSSYTYVADRRNHCIWRFTPAPGEEWSSWTRWGSYGTGNGQFKNPWGVAVDSAGNVYVADTGNDRIQKFDPNGRFLTKWGSRGSGNGQLFGPSDIEVDSGGNVYVVDQLNNRVQKFRPVEIEMVPPTLTPIRR